MTNKKAAICGARGYAGLDLAKLIIDHPAVELCAVSSRSENWALSDDVWNPESKKIPTQSPEALLDESLDVVFLALPAEASMHWAPQFIEKGISVIDLSGAFRLPLEIYQTAYGHKHTHPGGLEQAVYGLVPWQNEGKIKSSSLIANPGCYATSVLMGVLPLLKTGKVRSLIVDAKSGTTGAGRSGKESLILGEIGENFWPYKVGRHQHVPEILQFFKGFAQTSVPMTFCTHLLPIQRGILSTMYIEVEEMSSDDVGAAFESAYSNYPLVEYGPWHDGKNSIKRVAHSPLTFLNWHLEEGRLTLFSFIDNLMKGAASQAIENFNIQNDLDIATGLLGAKK